MPDVTRVLLKIEQGDASATDELLPLVYDELRRLAAARLASEKPGQTLQGTALVHEAYLRLVGDASETRDRHWNGRGHFFAAAAEAMRRILVERARRRKALRHGGGLQKVELSEGDLLSRRTPEEIFLLNDAIDALTKEEPTGAQLVKLRIFAGFSVEDAGNLLGMSRATAYRHWIYARAWLKDLMSSEDSSHSGAEGH